MPSFRRGFRGRGISKAQRRKKTWISAKIQVSTVQVPGFSTGLGLTATSPTTPGQSSRDGFIAVEGAGTSPDPFLSSIPSESTILRIRGSLVFPKNLGRDAGGSGALVETYSIGYGVTDITTLDADAYPGPLTNPDWDGWMFLRSSAVAAQEAEGSAVDIKAMRKINGDQAFFVMAEAANTGTLAGNNIVNWLFDLRLLILLP